MHEAEDVIQDALLKAYVALPRFEAGAPFRPWLLQIVANEARNRNRSAGRRHHLVSRVAEDRALTPQMAPSPEALAVAEEQRRMVVAEVAALRDQDRMAIAGRYFLDLSEAEIAVLLGCARGTVKSRLSRSLVRLRERLTEREVAGLLVALGALAAGLLAWPATRETIADRLGLRGVSVSHVDTLPTVLPAAIAAPRPETAATLAVPASLGLGLPVSREEAERRLGHAVLIPAALGEPDGVFGSTREVWLTYAPRPGLPPPPQAPGVAMLITEFNAQRESTFISKGLPPNTGVQDVQVGGRRGMWIDGAPHIFFRETSASVRNVPPRLAGNTLLWEQDGLTLRIESALDREAAISIADSIRGTD